LKTLIVLVLIAGLGWYFWNKHIGGPPQNFEHPVFGEIRATADIGGREIEMAVFARTADDFDCNTRALVSWSKALAACPTCKLQPAKCQAQLPPRYARLFDDVPIPSTYLSATAGRADERDGRVVVYGLTDREGEAVCEQLRTVLLQEYRGTAHCVKASGG
jgi:hypothetical protein